jgi:voltage-gated potassium channel
VSDASEVAAMTTMDTASASGPGKGQPRSPKDAAALRTFEARMGLPIILAAILPLVIAPSTGDWVGVIVGVVSWLVFLADFVVHRRRLVQYPSTRLGRFDLLIVVITAPWFLLPGAQPGSWVVLLRLARLARVLMATRGARRLFERLGGVALVALGMVIVGAWVAYRAEHPTNSEYATYGDSLWWAFVTLTTVGYGDIVPETATGRWAGVAIMITGVGVLGLLAGSLASFFQPSSDADESDDEAASASATDGLAGELAKLRTQVELLTEQLGRRPDEPGHGL